MFYLLPSRIYMCVGDKISNWRRAHPQRDYRPKIYFLSIKNCSFYLFENNSLNIDFIGIENKYRYYRTWKIEKIVFFFSMENEKIECGASTS